jgi:hypothetical protein
MSFVDKQRITAVEMLERLGYTFNRDAGWTRPREPAGSHAQSEADVMYAVLVLRADRLARRIDRVEDPSELAMITDATEAYEAMRWPTCVRLRSQIEQSLSSPQEPCI